VRGESDKETNAFESEKVEEQQSELKATKGKRVRCRKTPTKRRKRTGSREAECIRSKACFKAAIQSEVKAKPNVFRRKPALKPLFSRE
jgi:hypothetical protein